MKKIILALLFISFGVNAGINKEDLKRQGLVTEKFYQVYTLQELNKLAKDCMVKAGNNEDYQRVCSSAYLDRKYNL